MFISLDFFAPVVVIGKGPIHYWVIILHFHFNSVSRISSPVRWSLGAYLTEKQAKECEH